jgi:HK97 family phage prohead protease
MDRLICPFEVKVTQSDDGHITGYGSVFGNVDSHRDIVAKGAFKSSLMEAKNGNSAWPAMLLQHGMGDEVDSKMPVGIWTDIDEDDTGLMMQGKLALKTQRGAEAYELMKMTPRPALNGLSIGYRTKDFTMGSKTDKARRTLNAVDLVEVSLVTSPSNRLATVLSVKSGTIRDFEEFLRDEGGYSNAQAKAIAVNGYKSFQASDETDDLRPLLEMFQKAYSPDQPRSSNGEWGSGATAGAANSKTKEGIANNAAIAALEKHKKTHGSTPLLEKLIADAKAHALHAHRLADPIGAARDLGRELNGKTTSYDLGSLLEMFQKSYNPNQPRDSHGRFGAGGSGQGLPPGSIPYSQFTGLHYLHREFNRAIGRGFDQSGVHGAALGAALAVFVHSGAAKLVGRAAIEKYGPRILPQWANDHLQNTTGHIAKSTTTTNYDQFIDSLSDDDAKRMCLSIIENMSAVEKSELLAELTQ